MFFIDHWNRGEFLECRDVALELRLAAGESDRLFLEGLILAAGAFERLTRRDLATSRKRFRAALECLDDYPPRYRRFPAYEFVEALADWQAKVEIMIVWNEYAFSAEMIPSLPRPQGDPARWTA